MREKGFDLPSEPTFAQKGLKGFRYPLQTKDYEVYLVEVSKGHDDYIISEKITHTYYLLEGAGFFDIKGENRELKAGELIEVPPGVEYTYSGQMKLLLVMSPPWFEGNEKITKKNPAVD